MDYYQYKIKKDTKRYDGKHRNDCVYIKENLVKLSWDIGTK